MTPIQQLFLGVGAKKKTYLDDVFSTYLWEGNSTENRNINNGINLSGEGGMVWIKKRNGNEDNLVYDTNRGHNERIITNSDTDNAGLGQRLTGFNTNGFKLGTNTQVNASSDDYTSYSFRKAPGFFDAISYTGNGTSMRTISHSLGCRPGFVIVKRTVGGTGDWKCLHRYDFDKYLELNSTGTDSDSFGDFNNIHPTSTTFGVSNDAAVNKNGDSYVAYLFAEGPSDSVAFDGTGDYITAGGHSDYGMGTGDFTVECWVKFDDSANRGVFQISSTGISSSGGGGDGLAFAHNGSYWHIYANGTSYNSSSVTREVGKWYHVAMCRSSGTTKVFVDGSETHSFSDSTNYNGTKVSIGGYYSSSYLLKGNVSNFRVVKGTALYTGAFTPPTAALPAITNTKLLCCNTSSVTGSTIDVSQQILSSGDPQASSDYPSSFVDSNLFGDSGDQNLIKCGTYVGNGSSTGPEINLGWEPQWLLYKCTNANESWTLYDSMRGIVTGGNEPGLYPASNSAEEDQNFISLTSTGYKIKSSDTRINGSAKKYLFIAIRRPDGYVGKPAESGTDVFAIDTGNGNSNIPNFDSAFPVDFAWAKLTGSTSNWYTSARLLQGKEFYPDDTSAEGTGTNKVFDSNVGWHDSSTGSGYISHMWKRHAGFDVVTYDGNGTAGRQISHSLNKVPQMIWVKKRNGNEDWAVYHEGLNGGTNPANWHLTLNDSSQEGESSIYWNDTIPTSTVFTVGGSNRVNNSSGEYIAMLFASVDGISKVGSYTGTGSSGLSITTGFQPRFLIIKSASLDSTPWNVYDSVRGFSSGNDSLFYLNTTNAAVTNTNMGEFTSTGFTLNETYNEINGNGGKYIYYAHA